MKVTVIGTGYVGLVTGMSLAALGHSITCVGRDRDKISAINGGKSPFYEPGIEKLLAKVIKNGLFHASDSLDKSIMESDITILAVGTPTIDNKIDLSSIEKASEQVGKALGKVKKYHVVVVKSTVLPGITEKVVGPLLEKYSHKKVGEFGLCMNPEFLREGNALEDAMDPDRIVIGQFDERSGNEFVKLYAKTSCPKIFTNLKTAEMTKYASNALFATLISYANEIARIAESASGIDVLDVWKGVHLDKRLSPINGKKRIKPGVLNYILSGCGYGGSCFPKDTKALASFADEIKTEAKLIKSVIAINNTQPYRLILLLKKALGENLKDKKIAVLGLTFKPDTDDVRESAAFPVIDELLSEGARLTCHDPQAYKKSIPIQLTNPSVTLTNTTQEAIENVDAVVIITAWEEYKKLTPQFFKQYMRRPIVIDGRRIYDKKNFLASGIAYKGIGL